MDWLGDKVKIQGYITKYRYLLLLLLAGILLMTLPHTENKEQPIQQEAETEANEQDLEKSLEALLQQVSGAGKVAVLLTQKYGEQTIFQSDEDISSDMTRRDTVLVSDTDRKEYGLIRQVNPPVYQGAIVLCQGADSASVRLSIVEAVMSATGLTSDCITVLKMK